jgi:RNA polymerase sigma-54 factor
MFSSHMKQEQQIAAKPQQKLLLSLAMQEALHVLQMPVQELADWLQLKIEQNPLLEWTEPEEKDSSIETQEYKIPSKTTYSESRNEVEMAQPISLYEHLSQQAQQAFTKKEDLHMAKLIIGNLDEKGLLTIPLEKMVEGEVAPLQSILKVIQEFDPPGIAAKDLQESLLIQLTLQGKKGALSYRIVQECFDDLIHHRISMIQKKCGFSEKQIYQTIKQDIAVLDPFPGYRFRQINNFPLVPDVFLFYENESWKIEINERLLPTYRLSTVYQNSAFRSNSERSFLRKHLASAKWLTRTLQKRNHTLKRVTEHLLKAQSEFFTGNQQKIESLSIREVSQALSLHESTIARAISQKYISCSMGIFPLRSFFSQSLNTNVSCDTAKKTLRKLIDSEDKKKPLSDQQLLEKMRKMGIPCARRTITKYRKVLHIPSTRMRKIW